MTNEQSPKSENTVEHQPRLLNRAYTFKLFQLVYSSLPSRVWTSEFWGVIFANWVMASEQLNQQAKPACCTEKSLKALKFQLSSVRKKDFTLNCQVLKLKRRWSDVLYFKRQYWDRWTLGKLSAIILIWKSKVLLNERKRTNATKNMSWALCIFKALSFWDKRVLVSCAKILNKLRGRRNLGNLWMFFHPPCRTSTTV